MTISKFIIYGIPRVGSNYLISVLNNHPDILCHYEIFHKKEIFTGFWDKRMAQYNFGSLEERNSDPHAFLQRVFAADLGFKAIGYNLFPEHNQHIFLESLRDREQKKIILKRRDVLRNYVSWKIAMQTDIWTQREISKKGEKDKRIFFDKNQFLNRLQKNNNFYSFIETSLSLSRQKSLVITYEDFVRNPVFYTKQMFEFIEVDLVDVKIETEITKQNIEGLRDLIINYEDLLDFSENYLLKKE